MNRLIPVTAVVGLSVMMLAAPSMAGQPAKPGKLGVPTNVSCVQSGDQVTVLWDPVMGATNYRVMIEAVSAGEVAGEADELVETVTASPYAHALSDLTDDPTATVTAKVRAMLSKTGKGASKPSKPVPCQ